MGYQISNFQIHIKDRYIDFSCVTTLRWIPQDITWQEINIGSGNNNGWVPSKLTQICVDVWQTVNWVSIGSDNGLSPVRGQAIT